MENLEFSKDMFKPVSREEKTFEQNIRPSIGYWNDAWRRLRANKVALASLIIVIALVMLAIVVPMISHFSYDQQIADAKNLGPSLRHPFGTDKLGRDLLVRVMIGARISLLIGIGSSIIVLVIGSIYGAVSGLIGGKVDAVMMRIVEIIYSLPDMLIIILLRIVLNDPLTKAFDSGHAFGALQMLGPGILAMFIVYGLLYWVGMARIVRGQVLQLKEMEYVNAARALGADNKRLIFKHLLPNCIGQLVVTTMLQIPSAIFTEAFLSFLGIGVSKPLASLGSLASDALDGISSYPYRLMFPAIAISIIILAFNLFGDGLRDALDPRLKK